MLALGSVGTFVLRRLTLFFMQAIRFLLTHLLVPIGLFAAAKELPTGIVHLQTLDGIEEYELTKNGLRVLLMPNERLPVATVMVTYQVGSRNEAAGTTGATHILEHMMFKGTPRFNAEQGNDYSTLMEQIGARANATTWFDRTNYFATVPANDTPLTIELEADRMRNLLIREEDLASEMTVVRNEYERGENSPVRTLIKEIFGTAFMAHPYNHPTIGWRSDIENTNPEKLRKFYNTYYWPENAVATVIGGFDREATLTALAEHFGQIEPAPAPIPEVTTTEPPQLGPRRVQISRAGQVGVVMTGYKVPEATHEDWPALILIDQIVGADKSGRLYRALEDKGKASATFTFAPQLRDPGLFLFGAYLTPEATHEEVESILLEEIDRLIGGGVTEGELKRAKSVIRASLVYSRDGPYAIARQINDAIAMGDWTSYIDRPKDIEAVSADQIREVAERYFVERTRTTGWFVPEIRNRLSASVGEVNHSLYFRDPELYGPRSRSEQASTPVLPQPGISEVSFSSNMQQATVAGIEVVAIDLPVEGVVSFVGSFAAGDIMNPAEQPMLANLTASMLDKGTLNRDRFAIADLLDTLGADLGFQSSAHSLGFSGKFLRANAGSVLKLLAEQLREPAFDPEVLESVKTRENAWLLQAIDDTGYRAGSEMARLLYPPEHPNYSQPLDVLIKGLEAISVDEIADFHADYYGPKSMRIVFAGDIDFEQLKAALAVAFDSWEGGADYPDKYPDPLPNQSGNTRIPIADKPSASVQFGYNTQLQRTDTDYLPFMVGNYILGGSFQSRLMQEVRKAQGLTYDIRSRHEGDILTPGNWILGASFAPSMLEKGLAASRAVFEAWHAEGVSKDEVAAAIQTLSGSYLVGLSTTSRVAAQVHSFLQRGYPAEYIDHYPDELRQLDAARVNQAIRKYFDPTAVQSVIAGSLESGPDEARLNSEQTIRLRLDAPDPSWQLNIEAVYQSDDALLVLSRLSRDQNTMAGQVITTLSDSIRLSEIPELPVRHYILGKQWNWGDTSKHDFIDSIDAIRGELDAAQQIYPE